MNERDIFDERQETKTANYSCPHCRERNDYDVRWLKRTKRQNAQLVGRFGEKLQRVSIAKGLPVRGLRQRMDGRKNS